MDLPPTFMYYSREPALQSFIPLEILSRNLRHHLNLCGYLIFRTLSRVALLYIV